MASPLRTASPRRACLFACAALSAWSTLQCGPGADHRVHVELSYTFASIEEAAREVLHGLRRQDLERLRRLPLDEHEFRTLVWPELPASRPEVNLPVEYAWSTLRQNSAGGLAEVLASHGGSSYELRGVRIRGESTAYASFRIHRRVEVAVTDGSGRERLMRLFGSVLEKDGRFKIFSYVID